MKLKIASIKQQQNPELQHDKNDAEKVFMEHYCVYCCSRKQNPNKQEQTILQNIWKNPALTSSKHLALSL